MYQRKTKRRIYYLPGMISLVLLPLICIWYINPGKWFQHHGVLEVVMPDPPTRDSDKILYSISSLPKRNYHNINLTGEEFGDKVKLNNAQFELRRLLQEKDTINGLHIIFGNKTKYWEMVKAIDICKIENVQAYMLYRNDFWALNLSSKEKK